MNSTSKPSLSTAAAIAFASMLAALALGTPPVQAAIQIVYQTENLVDTNPGEDLWSYTYTVSGQAFELSSGFNLYYPWESFGAIELVTFPENGWGPVDLLNPEAALLLPGLLSAQAAEDLPAANWTFVVNVVWLDGGAGGPGSQRYELFDADFNVLDPPGTLGTVTQVIPEPQTGLLVLIGLAVLAALAMRRRSVRGGMCLR